MQKDPAPEEIPADAYREQRLANMKALQEMGYAPFGRAYERSGSLASVRAGFENGKRVSIAGRLSTARKMGKSIFADLRDGSDRFQVYARRDLMGEEPFRAFRLLDLGDIIGVEGTLFTTRTGEATLQIESWTLLAKALRTPPEKWHGLSDVEARYRQRYLDLASNQEVRDLFNRRGEMIHELRAHLHGRGFQEVETPIMQPHAGGAAARPFTTRYDALHADMYLRIAPELYLKRLLVGGFDKVYELSRNFRNEGLDRTHNPEFTMLEVYQAYGDLGSMRELVEGLIVNAAEKVFGSLKVGQGEDELDLTPPWREKTYPELIRERMGDNWYDLAPEEACGRARDEGLDIETGLDPVLVTHEVYEKLVEKTLQQPTFVTRLPSVLVPLAGRCSDNPAEADVFELVIRGQEIAPAYTELCDPLEQRRRLNEQAGEEQEKVDEDFLAALEHGMPPAGGMGVGIDRLFMILSGAESIRDVILFPQLRPR